MLRAPAEHLRDRCRYGTDDEKAAELARTLLELVSTDQARGALRRQHYSQQAEAALAAETVRFLGTAEFVAEQLRGQSTLEWSPAIIGLCKAAEHEVVARVLQPLRERCASLNLDSDLADKDLQRVARWCAGAHDAAPELGTVRHVLLTAANSKRRIETSALLQALIGHIRGLPRGGWLLDPQGLALAPGDLTTRFRNPAAHIASLDEQDYDACRDLVVAVDGLLWQLVDATS
jgi:hypothetical protein